MSMPSGLVQTNGLTAYVFPASQLGVLAQPTADGNATPIAPSDVLAMLPSSLAALNGPAYDTCGGVSEASAVCEIPTFAISDSSRGISFAGSRPNNSYTISVVAGQVQVTPGSAVPFGAGVAVQGWLTLVRNGRVVASNDGQNAETGWRSALAVLDSSTLAIVIGYMDMVGFATAMATYLGATDAVYTDGGGSTALVVPQNTYGSTENRRVAAWLVVNPPVGLASVAGTIVFSLVIAGLAAAGYYVLTRPTEVRKNPRKRRKR